MRLRSVPLAHPAAFALHELQPLAHFPPPTSRFTADARCLVDVVNRIGKAA